MADDSIHKKNTPVAGPGRRSAFKDLHLSFRRLTRSPRPPNALLKAWLGPALLAGTFLLFAGMLLWMFHSEQTRRQQQDLAGSAQSARESFRLRLQGNEDYLRLLAGEWIRGTLNSEEFQQRISRYVAAHPELINVTWVDAKFVIRDVAPLEPNRQIVGLALDLPEPKRAANLAREHRAPAYTRPFEAIQGRSSFEVWVPVFRDEEFIGLFAGVYSCPKLLEEAFPSTLAQRYYLQLRDATGSLLGDLPPSGALEPQIWSDVDLSPPGQGVSLRLQAYGSGHGGLRLLELLCGALALGMVYSLLALKRDVTRRQQSEKELRASEERWKFALEGAGDGVWDWDIRSGKMLYSKRYKEMLGFSPGELENHVDAWDSRIHPDSQKLVKISREACLSGRAPSFSVEYRMCCKNGRWIWVLGRGKVVSRDAAGNPLRMIGTQTDITDKKESENLIWRQANFDPLTQLPNRSMFQDRLEYEIKKTQRQALPLALFFIDLDQFKEVNDTLGHEMGDVLLVEAARRLSDCVRASDTVARMGGDEFTVILSQLDDPGCTERIAQDIIEALAAPFLLGEEKTFVSASIGITFYPTDATEPEDLLRHADQAMYAAKSTGRNRFSYYTPALQEAVQNRMRLTNDLRGALAAEQFRLYYQPIVELATGRIHKAEALIRWQHPRRGLVSPAEFIPLAEAVGLIVDIGDWVFEQSVRQVKHWRAMYHPAFQISVNTSPVQFRSEVGLNNTFFAHLQDLDLPGQGIAIEITEGLLLDAAPNVMEVLLAFRDRGIQVSLDDFGTGYSSLSYLQKFDIDYLKIDQSFVRNLRSNSADMTLCEAIIVMAHKLGLKVVAEGVETPAQRDLLAAAGCDFVQGYLYSRPLPPVEFEALLMRETSQI